MKLILRADVENLGNLGDVVTVKPGYGRNFLLPQGLAMVASEANMKAFELERKKLQERMDALRADAQALCAKLEALEVVIPHARGRQRQAVRLRDQQHHRRCPGRSGRGCGPSSHPHGRPHPYPG